MHRIAFIFIGCALLAACASPERQRPLQFGVGYLVAEDYASAKAHFEKLHETHPRDPYIALNLGVALEKLGETDRAAEMYRIAIEEGEHTPVHLTVTDGNQARQTTSVAMLARRNLERLDG